MFNFKNIKLHLIFTSKNFNIIPGFCNWIFSRPLKTLKYILPSKVTLHVWESSRGWGVCLQSEIVPKLSNTLMVKYQTER